QNRDDSVGSLLQAVMGADPEGALQIVIETPELQRHWALSNLGRFLASDPDSLLEKIETLAPGEARMEIVSGMAEAFPGTPEQALEWADQLLPGERRAAVWKIISGAAAGDPAA